MKPNYDKIYKSIIIKLGLYGKKEITYLLNKKDKSVLDILKLNELLFGIQTKEAKKLNHKYRAYDEKTVRYILDYQKHKKLTNKKVAELFGISRTTITKWHKIFDNKIASLK